LSNRLYIGNRRYSSWSLRGWLAVRLADLAVEDIVIPMQAGPTPAIKAVTPAGLVPVLEHNGLTIWDSLAICEYCAEHAPLWPADPRSRAVARSAAAEMHAGFRDLRGAMPMNLGRTFTGRSFPDSVLQDIDRIDVLWRQCLQAHRGPFLFGAEFTIADVMYAPVVARFLTYLPSISTEAVAYCRAVRAHPLIEQWYGLAELEPAAWLLAKYE
jgi:glutathione S-transferase